MKKRTVSLFFVVAYILVPAMAVGIQAYLTDKVVQVSHTIERPSPTVVPASLEGTFPRDCGNETIRL